jgi:hypothetical protein
MKETLEEASVINYKKLYEGEPLTQDVPIDAFKQGAKWQMKRMYSEEEVLEILTERCKHFGTNVKPFRELLLKQDLEWFEQFKKK